MGDENTSVVPKKPAVRITINDKWCKKCGICIGLCPKKVFVAGAFGEPIIKNPTECIQCMQCESRCPDFAIEVEEKKKAVPKTE